jgi:hypothetical protein
MYIHTVPRLCAFFLAQGRETDALFLAQFPTRILLHTTMQIPQLERGSMEKIERL